MRRRLYLISIVILSIILLISSYRVYGYNIDSTIITVYEDGSVMITQTIAASSPPEDIELTLLGTPVYIEANSFGTPIPVEVSAGTAHLTSPGEKVTVRYVVADLTNKVGEDWILSYTSPYPTIVILSENIMMYEISPENFDVMLVNDTVAFVFQPGPVEIKYVLIPQVPDGTSTPPPQPPYNQFLIGFWPLIIIAVIIILAVAIYFLSRGSRSKREADDIYKSLDSRDNKILTTLSKYGELTARELIDRTKIPKTPLYRRLRKLIDLGLIESVSRAGVVYYRIKSRK